MMDEKSMMAQTQEIQMLAHEITSEGVRINDDLQVIAIIDKLSPSWKEFQTLQKKGGYGEGTSPCRPLAIESRARARRGEHTLANLLLASHNGKGMARVESPRHPLPSPHRGFS
ncbi:UBN2_2 domain-containing protein [Cephalotus follicularis]|uniref:UBN2_2 domain-containing protein n=1 Tax=Cephalotus follicularis TaxID=3775 RepID=A0A1Q3BWT6_CEPFO|nr:UBN2_2 domain-containing protein [Cephalotus follicularis]